MANFQLTQNIPSSDGNSPIKDYVIEYRQVGSPTWLLYSDSISSSNAATIEGLDGCLNYEFRINSYAVYTSIFTPPTSLFEP